MLKRHKESTYISDGVYIRADDYSPGAFVLTTGSHIDEEADNRIYLEPEVVTYLLNYIRQWHFVERGVQI